MIVTKIKRGKFYHGAKHAKFYYLQLLSWVSSSEKQCRSMKLMYSYEQREVKNEHAKWSKNSNSEKNIQNP